MHCFNRNVVTLLFTPSSSVLYLAAWESATYFVQRAQELAFVVCIIIMSFSKCKRLKCVFCSAQISILPPTAYDGNRSDKTFSLPHKMPSKHNANFQATKYFQQRTAETICTNQHGLLVHVILTSTSNCQMVYNIKIHDVYALVLLRHEYVNCTEYSV